MKGITLEGVCKSKRIRTQGGDGALLRVLDNCTASFPPGRVTTLLGPSGAGKSTLLRVINRLEDPDSGKVFLDGRATAEFPVIELRQKVGFVGQEPVMFPGTVEDNLRAIARLKLRTDRELDPIVPEVIEKVALDRSFLARDALKLSVGQKQRVAVARALAANPEFLLLDEPTSALDPASSESLLRTVRELCSKHELSILMVTHTMDIARRTGDHCAVLIDGRIVSNGPTGEVFGPGASAQVKEFLEGGNRR